MLYDGALHAEHLLLQTRRCDLCAKRLVLFKLGTTRHLRRHLRAKLRAKCRNVFESGGRRGSAGGRLSLTAFAALSCELRLESVELGAHLVLLPQRSQLRAQGTCRCSACGGFGLLLSFHFGSERSSGAFRGSELSGGELRFVS